MSTQEIGALIDSVNEMTATVAGKMSEIDQKVDEAQGDFNQFIETADDRYVTRTKTQIFINGDKNKFYPVYIPAYHNGIARLEIARPVHDNASWAGAMTAVFDVQNNAWSGYPDFLIMDMYRLGVHAKTPDNVKNDGFIAHLESGIAYVRGAIFWLRGGHTYYVSSSLFNFKKVSNHPELVTDAKLFDDTIRVFESGFHTNSSNVELNKTPIDTRQVSTVPSLNYVRGM